MSEARGELSGTIPEQQQGDGKQAQLEGCNTYSLKVTGRVQGVGYRDFARRTAESLMVGGWVRNEADGSVSVLLQSPQTKLIDMMVERLKCGPPGAEVTEVYVEQLVGEERCDSFFIKR